MQTNASFPCRCSSTLTERLYKFKYRHKHQPRLKRANFLTEVESWEPQSCSNDITPEKKPAWGTLNGKNMLHLKSFAGFIKMCFSKCFTGNITSGLRNKWSVGQKPISTAVSNWSKQFKNAFLPSIIGQDPWISCNTTLRCFLTVSAS